MYQIIYRYGLLGVVVSSFFVSLVVYIKAYQDNEKSAFLLVNVATGMWALCLFAFHTSYSHEMNVFWLRFSHLAAIFVPVTFIHFVLVLLDELPQRKKQLTLFYLIALVLGISSFTDLSISGVTYKRVMGYHLIPGPAYKIFSIMFFFLMTYGFFLMIKALRKSSGFKKNQIRYFLVGSTLGFGGAISTFFPLYNINIPPLGILAVPSYGIILAYAMLKHRLMDIRTIVGKGIIYSTVTAVVFALFVFIGFKMTGYYQFPSGQNLKVYFYILALCLFVVLILNPLLRNMEQLIERLLFKRARNSYQELRKGSQELLTILDKSTLSRYFPQAVTQATEAKWGSLWLFDERNGSYYIESKVGEKENGGWLDEGRFLNQYKTLLNLIKKERKPLLREEIYSHLKNSTESKMRETDFSLVIPLFFEDSVRGCLFVGEKRSGDLFSPYELQALTLFSDQASIAFANAQLFQQIQRMKEYSERIVNNVGSGLIVIDGEGKITTFNRRVEKMTGLSEGQVRGESPEILPSSLSEVILKSWKNKKPVHVPELSLRVPEKDPLTVSLNTSLIKEEKGVGVIVILVDLTEVKTLEEKIRQTEKMASIGSMVSQLAHEIKNPLSSIKTFTELLPEKSQDNEFKRSFLSVVSQEVQRIDDLINRMLNLGRADTAQYKRVQVKNIVDDVFSSLTLQLQEREVRVNVREEKSDLPAIWADPQSLREVFSNILVNSIQAMPEGGEISIVIEGKKDVESGDDFIEINITDQGGGVPPKYLSRIFDPFFTTKKKGSGLGLYICYQIIRAYRGEIKVKNTDSGAIFTILLPTVRNTTTAFAPKERRIYG